jgi:hypothetical protein
MTHSALIRFAPVFTRDRFDDPAWAKPGRTMYERLDFWPTKTCPLLVDHDDSKEIGTVTELSRMEWLDGPWFTAVARVTDAPAWLKRGTRVSFGFSPLHTRDVHIRDSRAEVIGRGLVNEVSVLSPGKRPAEPLAEVLSVRAHDGEPAAVRPSERAAAGEVIAHGSAVLRRERRAAAETEELRRRMEWLEEMGQNVPMELVLENLRDELAGRAGLNALGRHYGIAA